MLPLPDEAGLITRAQTDPAAFGQLYDHYLPLIYRFMAARVRQRALAEDLTADTFEKALRALPRYTDQGHPFSAWLYKIAANILKNHYARTALFRTLLPRLGPTPSEPPASSAQEQLMQEAMRQLSAADQTILQLKILDEVTVEDACFILGCSRQTYYVRIHRATTRLQHKIAVLAERRQLCLPQS